MRVLLIVAWLFAGLAGVIYHLGPGQEHLEVDRVNALLGKARQHVASENYQTALLQFDEVLAALPEDKQEVAQRVLLEKTKAQMMASQLPDARATLQTLLEDLRADEDADPAQGDGLFEVEPLNLGGNPLRFLGLLVEPMHVDSTAAGRRHDRSRGAGKLVGGHPDGRSEHGLWRPE